jgi:hypothetical protein
LSHNRYVGIGKVTIRAFSCLIVYLIKIRDGYNICRWLYGANVNAKDEYGSTALMLAAKEGHLDVVRFLVEHGADIFEKDKDNKDASNHAMDHGHEEVAKYLAELKSAADLGYMKRG